MKKVLWVLAGLVALAILIGIPVGLYFLGGADQSALERLRDIVIVLFGVFLVLSTLLLAALLGALAWLVLTLRGKMVPLFDEKISPLLDTLNDTAGRVKGTTEFMTEEVASPVISFYGTIAKARAMTKVVTGRDRKPGPSVFSRIRKR
jgi:hypothetical protein